MVKKNINYISKDFNSFKTKLINFAKTYYPNTYNDFSESSPGMMLIEMAAYVGDVLSLYQDNQIQENFLQFSKQRKNLLSQAYVYGYRPQITSVSNTTIDVYQIIPSINISGSILPDYSYCLNIDEGVQIQSSINPKVKFYVTDKIDFSISGSNNNTDVSVYSLDGNQLPNFYLLKKQRKAYSGEVKTKEYSFNEPQRFTTIELNDSKIIKILNVTDSNNNIWYEVPYLAQETIFDKVASNDLSTPYFLKLRSVPRRFISKFKSNNVLEIQFGPGVSNSPDEEIIPNFENIGLGLPYGTNKLNTAFDPSNFLYTGTYGISPSNTTLTFRYIVGGGVEANTPSNTLNILSSGNVSFINNNLDSQLSNTIINSLSFNNENPGVGGGDGDTNEEIKLNSLASYPTQLRAVTLDDYNIRVLSLPPEFGVVSKSYINKDSYSGDKNLLSLYILSKDINNKLCTGDNILKQNIQTYLKEYNSETDAINIKDAFIINIGVNFDITLRPNYNNRDVINKCLQEVKKHFDTDKWNINQPIIISEIYNLLDKVDGVQTVKSVKITNKSGEENNYTKYSYDIDSANINGVIYPSLDPSIFEIKFPDIDINGKSVSF